MAQGYTDRLLALLKGGLQPGSMLPPPPPPSPLLVPYCSLALYGVGMPYLSIQTYKATIQILQAMLPLDSFQLVRGLYILALKLATCFASYSHCNMTSEIDTENMS